MDIYTMDAKNLLMFAQNRTKKQQQSSADDVDKSKRETQNDHLTIGITHDIDYNLLWAIKTVTVL